MSFSIIWTQGDVGSRCNYTLPVMDIVNEETFMPLTTELEDGGNITYLLPANRRYSTTTFEVETAVGTIDNISNINFSESQYVHVALNY